MLLKGIPILEEEAGLRNLEGTRSQEYIAEGPKEFIIGGHCIQGLKDIFPRRITSTSEYTMRTQGTEHNADSRD